MNFRRAVFVFDVDGTLTSENYANDEVSDLRPNYPVLEIALSLSSLDRDRIAVVTARPHYLLGETRTWLAKQGLHPRVILTRNPGDHRPDHEVRVDQVKKVIEILGRNIVLFDDKYTNCVCVRKILGVPSINVKQ